MKTTTTKTASRGVGPALREFLSTALELVGIVAVAAGCWLLLPALGVIVAGLGLVGIGYLIGGATE